MKARVKATGNIIDVEWYGHNSMGTIYADVTHTQNYYEYELDFDTVYDYWAYLAHQYAGMTMQALIKDYREAQGKHGFDEKLIQETCAKESIELAHALVEKLRDSNEKETDTERD